MCRKHYTYWWRHGVVEPPALEIEPLKLSDEDAAWVAAIIDGEGWIGLMEGQRKFCRAYWPVIGVGNTKERLIDELILRTGLGRKSFSARPAPAKDFFTWTVGNRKGVEQLLKAILPKLILKTRQAKLLLLLPPLNARANVRRARIQRLIRKLNKRGC